MGATEAVEYEEITDADVVLHERRGGYSTHRYDFDDATRAIIGCALEAHRALGPGFREVVYQRALALELQMVNLGFDRAVKVPIFYKDRWIATRQSHASRVDEFKVLLGLPPDARADLDAGELDRLQGARERLAAGAQATGLSGEIPPADAPVVLREPGRKNAGPLELDPVTKCDGEDLEFTPVQGATIPPTP